MVVTDCLKTKQNRIFLSIRFGEPKRSLLTLLAIAAMLNPIAEAKAETVFNQPRPMPSLTEQQSLPAIERSIWLAAHHELADLEYEVTQLVQTQPRSPYAHYLLATLYLRMFEAEPGDIRRFRVASQLSEQTLRLDDSVEFGYLVTARVMDIMGFTDKAIDLVDPRKNKMIKESWRTVFYRAQLSSGRANYAEFNALVNHAISLSQSSADLLVPLLVSFLQVHDDPADIVRHLSVWNQKINHPGIKKGLALAYSDLKEVTKAEKLYREIASQDTNDIEAVINRSIILHREMGDTSNAIKQMEPVVDKLDKLPRFQKNLAFGQLADMYLEKKNFLKASEYFLKVFGDSQNYQTWIAFCREAYIKRKHFQEFARLLEETKTTVPGISFIYALQGEVLSNELDQQQAAVQAFSDAILLEPDQSSYYTGMGLAYYRLEEIQIALQLFKKASDIDPKDSIALYNEACMLAMLGRNQEALGSLKEALALNPKLALTAINDDDFKSLREFKQFKMLTDNSEWAPAISTTSSKQP